MKKYFCFALLLAALLAGGKPAMAKGYTYAHADGEYSITLPEAPTAVTIWAGDPKNPVPLIDVQPKYGAVGEVATFKRVHPDTGDSFEISITFVRADRDFLLSMTQEKMLETLQKQYADSPLDTPKFSFSSGTDTLKWATITGLQVDEKNNLFANAAHYLTAQESVMLVKVKYHGENKDYQKLYDDIAASIKFTGK